MRRAVTFWSGAAIAFLLSNCRDACRVHRLLRFHISSVTLFIAEGRGEIAADQQESEVMKCRRHAFEATCLSLCRTNSGSSGFPRARARVPVRVPSEMAALLPWTNITVRNVARE